MRTVTVVRTFFWPVEFLATRELHKVSSALDQIFRVRVERPADEKQEIRTVHLAHLRDAFEGHASAR